MLQYTAAGLKTNKRLSRKWSTVATLQNQIIGAITEQLELASTVFMAAIQTTALEESVPAILAFLGVHHFRITESLVTVPSFLLALEAWELRLFPQKSPLRRVTC